MSSKNGVPIIGAKKPGMSPKDALDDMLRQADKLEAIAIIGFTKDDQLVRGFSDITLKDLHYLGGVLQEMAMGPLRAAEGAKAMQQMMADKQIKNVMKEHGNGAG